MNVTSMDLSLAWSRVRYDIVDRRTFVQRPGEISLVEIDAPGLLRALEAALAADAHSATRPLMSEVPKGKGGVRPGPWLTIEDRIIYYAAVGACLPAIHGELSWAQGTVDFGYQLATDPVRPKWLKRNAQSWASFQAQSIELANSAAWVVLADITAFYESVDHNTLLSQLREAGAPPEATRLLDRLLRQWSSAGRGIPQGLSASDILGKFYLNRVDRRLHDHEQLRSVRWVDDMRIFCESEPMGRQVLMKLAVLLRERSLHLQAAKCEVLCASEALSRWGDANAMLQETRAAFLDNVGRGLKLEGPYLTVPQADRFVREDPGESEVLRTAYTRAFLEEDSRFDKSLWHFLLNRLAASGDAFAADHALSLLTERPEETAFVLDYLRKLDLLRRREEDLLHFLATEYGQVYPYQKYEIVGALVAAPGQPSDALMTMVRTCAWDPGCEWYLRAAARDALARFGHGADREALEASYSSFGEQWEKAEIILSLEGMEKQRRNALFAAVAGHGRWPERAVQFVKGRAG